VAAATTPFERAEALIPEGELERFEFLRERAADALGDLDSIVREAFFFRLAEGGMPWPDGFNDGPGSNRRRPRCVRAT
jgi:hypothetical protein